MNISELSRIASEITHRSHSLSENMLLSETGIDSLSFYKVIIEIEKRYGIRLNEDELFSCQQVRELLALVSSTCDNKL